MPSFIKNSFWRMPCSSGFILLRMPAVNVWFNVVKLASKLKYALQISLRHEDYAVLLHWYGCSGRTYIMFICMWRTVNGVFLMTKTSRNQGNNGDSCFKQRYDASFTTTACIDFNHNTSLICCSNGELFFIDLSFRGKHTGNLTMLSDSLCDPNSF